MKCRKCGTSERIEESGLCWSCNYDYEHRWMWYGLYIFIFLSVMGVTFLIIYAISDEKQIKEECEFYGEYENCGRVKIQCIKDCNDFNYEYFKWINGRSSRDSCYCIDNENKPVRLWG